MHSNFTVIQDTYHYPYNRQNLVMFICLLTTRQMQMQLAGSKTFLSLFILHLIMNAKQFTNIIIGPVMQ